MHQDDVNDRWWTLVYMTWSPAERQRLYRIVARASRRWW
jgi:hypothetical protein